MQPLEEEVKNLTRYSDSKEKMLFRLLVPLGSKRGARIKGSDEVSVHTCVSRGRV